MLGGLDAVFYDAALATVYFKTRNLIKAWVPTLRA